MGNVIAGQPGAAISLSASSASLLLGNRIGTTADGSRIIGNGVGISVAGAATQETIGGTNAGEANVVTGSVLGGIEIASSAARIAVRGNSIFANGALAVDLRTMAAVTGSSATAVTGTLNSTPSGDFTIDVYASSACDSSGNGEAQRYLGSAGYRATARIAISGNRRPVVADVLRGRTRAATSKTLRFALDSRRLSRIQRALEHGRTVVATFTATVKAGTAKAVVRRAHSKIIAAAAR